MSRVVELRQYTLKPSRRDVLIDLFEREFVESQQAQGIDIIGTFRDASDADRFVWLRGFLSAWWVLWECRCPRTPWPRSAGPAPLR